jgi:tripartite-type tricarboxylate transporter receptor subunit TctC
MNFTRHQLVRFAAAVIAVTVLASSSHCAWSQATRTIKIVVPTPPGGVLDIVARLLAEQIGRTGGPTLVIENRPGAGTIVGTESVSRAAPDGGTLLLNGNPFLVNPLLRKVNYDPLTSFEPVCALVSSPEIIVVNSASPYRTLAELLDRARAKPGELTLASIGPGSNFQLEFEILKRAAKVDMTFVPYPGNGPAINALLGGHVTSMFGTYSNMAEYLKTGKLRALVVANRTGAELLTHIPTGVESGYTDFEDEAWFGAFAPAKTPKETVSRIEGWFTAATRVPDIEAKLAVQGLYRVGTCGADFATLIRKQYGDYGRIIREANIKAE